MYRTAIRLCTVAAVGLTAWGVGLTLRGEPDAPVGEPPLVIDTLDHDLATVPVGPVEVVFEVTNPAGRPRRIIGFAEG